MAEDLTNRVLVSLGLVTAAVVVTAGCAVPAIAWHGMIATALFGHQRFGVSFMSVPRQADGAAELLARLSTSASPGAGPCNPGGTQKNFAEFVAAAIPEHARDKPIELWWQDEARVGQKGNLTYIWADKGSRPRAPRDQRYDWAYKFGAVCPARGIGAALVLPIVSTAAMNLHLA